MSWKESTLVLLVIGILISVLVLVAHYEELHREQREACVLTCARSGFYTGMVEDENCVCYTRGKVLPAGELK